MSQTILVVLEDGGYQQYSPDLNPESPGSDYGCVIARLIPHLDSLATFLGVHPLSRYLYTDPELLRPLLDELQGGARENVQRILASQREWHEPTDGLLSVEALLSALSTSTLDERLLTPLRLGGSLDPVLWDLRALRNVLAQGTEPFHLEAV